MTVVFDVVVAVVLVWCVACIMTLARHVDRLETRVPPVVTRKDGTA